mmetsp:Transcript_90193/g.179446  ORF Transcript_90193/g.179446 Transcript_90193/m.179446 type:complete len:100 (-) Transcript_90193:192-491(-)
MMSSSASLLNQDHCKCMPQAKRGHQKKPSQQQQQQQQRKQQQQWMPLWQTQQQQQSMLPWRGMPKNPAHHAQAFYYISERVATAAAAAVAASAYAFAGF